MVGFKPRGLRAGLPARGAGHGHEARFGIERDGGGMIASGSFGNKFEFITVAAERAKQLQRGARSRIETQSLKAVTIAQEEVLAGTVEYSYGAFPEDLQGDQEVGEVTTEAYAGDDIRMGALEQEG